MALKNRLATAGLVVVLAGALGACGSSSTSGSATSTPASATSSGAAATTSASASSAGSGTSGGSGASYGATPAIDLAHVAGPVETPQVAGENVSISVGSGKPLTFKKGAQLRIAMFVAYGVTQYFHVAEHGAEVAAARFGYPLTVFDAGTSLGTEQQQIQSAINSHKYNAFLFFPLDLSLCNLATQTAPAAGILVAVYANTCASATAPNSELWSPGTLNYTGGASPDYDDIVAIAQKLVSEFPGPQKVVLIDGPSSNPSVAAVTQAFKQVTASHPEFKVTYAYNAYDPSGGLADINAWLSANQNTTTLIICYSPDAAPGCIAGMQSRGLAPGKIPMYTSSGNPNTVTFMKQGWIFATNPYYSGSAAAGAVRSLHDAVNGLPVPRVILNDGHAIEPYTAKTPPYLTWIPSTLVKSGQYVPES